MTKTIAELTGQDLDTLSADVQVEATYIGRRQLMDGGDSKEWEHDAWSVSLTYKDNTYQDIAYRMGIGHSPQPPNSYAQPERDAFYHRTLDGKGGWQPTPPTAADVLSSLMMDISGLDQGFESWAEGLGYDSDSRKAEATYRTCLETLPRLHALLGDAFGRFETAAQEY